MAKRLNIADMHVGQKVHVIPNYEFIVDEFIYFVYVVGNDFVILQDADALLYVDKDTARKYTFWDESPSTEEWCNEGVIA